MQPQSQSPGLSQMWTILPASRDIRCGTAPPRRQALGLPLRDWQIVLPAPANRRSVVGDVLSARPRRISNNEIEFLVQRQLFIEEIALENRSSGAFGWFRLTWNIQEVRQKRRRKRMAAVFCRSSREKPETSEISCFVITNRAGAGGTTPNDSLAIAPGNFISTVACTTSPTTCLNRTT